MHAKTFESFSSDLKIVSYLVDLILIRAHIQLKMLGLSTKIVLMDALFVASLCFFFPVLAADTIRPNQSILLNQTLVSAGETFELGFFVPTGSTNTNRYLGIWFNKSSVRAVIWVANRETAITDSFGELRIDEIGNLVILNGTKSVIWSSSSFLFSNRSKNELPVAQLLDTGNLVLKYENQDSYIWQSFDHPTDTIVDGMKFGFNLRTGLNRHLTSWKNETDPSPGNYTFSVDRRGYVQPFLRKGSTSVFRSGPWNGLSYSGAPEMKPTSDFSQNFVSNSEEVYFISEKHNNSVVARFKLDPSGLIKRLLWNERNAEWKEMMYVPKDRCDQYSLCGAYGTCNIDDSPVCQCLKGFTPKLPMDWKQADWGEGCRRSTPLNCLGRDGFLKYSSLKLPDTSNSTVNTTMSLNECELECLKNCNCTAFANSDTRGQGSGCLLWFGDLIDIKQFNTDGQDLYVRVAASELGADSREHKKKTRLIAVISVSVALGMLFLSLIICWIIWKTRRKERDKSQEEEMELPLFHFDMIVRATNNFAFYNKLGEGGFGPVYKGKLPTGEEIAVKRLSGNSGQGLSEFKNEIILIAKLQHRNLVRLLGCCIQNDENMLIYEYMPNGSLDYYFSDNVGGSSLNWLNRVHIIEGIAQGLLYLHRHSRLRIIHRDLKASNILLDAEMNPKISDFGMARIFGGDQVEAKTKRVVGTYGYMSPEYAIDGRFSMKSDVFSFGVLVLEIVSKKKNRGFLHPGHDFNLLGHAWNLWNEKKAMELVDATVGEAVPESEALRLIQVALLCVQQSPEDRPNMSSVVLMLCSESTVLPQPKQPGFYNERSLMDGESSSSGNNLYSWNEVTVTLLQGR